MRYRPILLISFLFLLIVFAGTTYLAGHANQKPDTVKSIMVYTTLPAEEITILAQEYEKIEHVRVNMVPLSEQDLLTRIQAEKAQPNADVILTTKAVLTQAKKQKALKPYTSEQTDIVPDRFKDDEDAWVGTWYDPIVFAANQDFLKQIPQPPAKYSDLAKENKIRLAITDFLAADASANLLYTLASVNGENQTLAYFKKIHPQIVQYSKFLVTPVRMAGMGECDIAIAVQSEAIRYINDGFPLKIIYPEDGTAFLLTGAAVLDGSRHSGEAKQFIDWLIQGNALSALEQDKIYFIPTNPEAYTYRDYNIKSLKLLDNTSILSAEQQHKLLDRWVKSARLGAKE